MAIESGQQLLHYRLSRDSDIVPIELQGGEAKPDEADPSQ